MNDEHGPPTTLSEPLTVDLDRIVDFPWEVLEYLSWLRQRPSSREPSESYLFEAPRVRFTLSETDLVVAERGIGVSVTPSGLRLTTPRAASEVAVEGLGPSERATIERLLLQLDGQAPIGALRARLDAPAERVLDALLAAAFGKLIFAPLAVMSAERAISGIEITRFPGSPYEVARPYWKNMGAVRAAADLLFASVDDDQAFVRELRKLHVVLLMGADLQSYYQPASPISSGRAAPGRFMLTPAELIDCPDGALFVSGPRVAAVPLGGAFYHALLARSLGEPEAAPHGGVDRAELDWGRLVHARAPTDPAPAPWYCPPRPLHTEHLRTLRGSLGVAARAARAADRSACVTALAAFHQDFVRLHPFHCGNQSLAMNLVNGVLNQALGAGMPHLILDHLAFRLSPGAYARVFRRAVDAYVDPGASVAARYLRLASNRTRTFELVRQLGAASTLEEALALTQADATTARLLLLTDD
jgi:hypothetical protein